MPPEYPYPTITDVPGTARELLDELANRPGGQWVADMYRRHRNAKTAAPAAAEPAGVS
jgi:hypothetical protein